MITRPYSRVNSLKTIPFPEEHTLRCQINVPPPPTYYFFDIFPPPPPELNSALPFITFSSPIMNNRPKQNKSMLGNHFTHARVHFWRNISRQNRTPQHARAAVSCDPCFVKLNFSQNSHRSPFIFTPHSLNFSENSHTPVHFDPPPFIWHLRGPV